MNNPIDTKLIYAEPEISLISKSQLKKVFPKKINDDVLEKFTEIVNTSVISMDSVFREHYRDNLIGLIDVLKDSKIKFEDYVKAVQFCSYKMAGHSDTRAYALTFPERVARMEREKVPSTYLSIYASTYAKNKIVVDVLAKMLVPTHIMYQDYFHLAIKTQVEIMTDDSVSPKVRSDAANSLMTHLKQPEIKKMELDVGVKESGVIQELANALGVLSNTQQEAMQNGKISMKDLRQAVIIEVEPNDNN